MSKAALKAKVFRYLKQPSTQHGINVLANLVAVKYGVPPEAVLTGGALIAAGILIATDDDKRAERKDGEQ